METKVHSYIVKPKNDPIFSEMATIISVDDEAAGVFITVKQCAASDTQELRINPEEWPLISKAINDLLAEWGN